MGIRGPGGSVAAASNPGGMTGNKPGGQTTGSGGGLAAKRASTGAFVNPFTGATVTEQQHSVLNARDINRSPKLGNITNGQSSVPASSAMRKKQLINSGATPLTPGQSALEEAAKQRAQNKPFVKGAETILGMLPGPVSLLGMGLRVGDAMSEGSEDALRSEEAKHPGTVKTDPNVPGSVSGRINGMMYSNRADVPGYNGTNGSRGLGQQPGAADEQTKKKNRQQRPTTLLGSVAAPLGTAANPSPIA